MGYIRHNAIIVTGAGFAEGELQLIHTKAKSLLGSLVSEIIESECNGYFSFFIAPDGSKESFNTSDNFDDKRKEICDFIDGFAYDDGSNPINFVDIAYGEDYTVAIQQSNSKN